MTTKGLIVTLVYQGLQEIEYCLIVISIIIISVHWIYSILIFQFIADSHLKNECINYNSFCDFRNKGKSIRKKIRQSIRRKSTRRKKNDDNAASLAKAAVAAAEKAEAEIEAVEIGVLESSTRERSQRRSGSSTSRKSTVKFVIEGELENMNISSEDGNVFPQKKKTSTSLNVFLPNQGSTLLESG